MFDTKLVKIVSLLSLIQAIVDQANSLENRSIKLAVKALVSELSRSPIPIPACTWHLPIARETTLHDHTWCGIITS